MILSSVNGTGVIHEATGRQGYTCSVFLQLPTVISEDEEEIPKLQRCLVIMPISVTLMGKDLSYIDLGEPRGNKIHVQFCLPGNKNDTMP